MRYGLAGNRNQESDFTHMINFRRFTFCLGMSLFVMANTALRAQDGVPLTGPPETAQKGMRTVEALGMEIRKLGDWSAQADNIERFIDGMWEKNGWTDESDQFTKKVNQEVARIPPWNFTARVDKMTELVSQRYELDARQRLRFQSTLYREVFGLMITNADTITDQVREYVGGRIEGRPILAEDVQRWTRESEPLMADVQNRLDRITAEMSRNMKDKQREILDRDRKAIQRQLKFIEGRRAEWAKGKWSPEEWGMGDAPNQPDAAGGDQQPSADPSAIADGRSKPISPFEAQLFDRNKVASIAVAEDENTWKSWVREFIKANKLDMGQQETVWSILAELEERAVRFRSRHSEALGAVPLATRSESPVFDPLRDLFWELQRRSLALLTEVQRLPADDEAE